MTKSFGDILYSLRDSHNLSQKALEKETGISSTTIASWETGKSLPKADSLKTLAEYFDVSTDYLLGLSTVKKVNPELQAICDYTGLSEDTITFLNGNKDYQSIIDLMLNDKILPDTDDVKKNCILEKIKQYFEYSENLSDRFKNFAIIKGGIVVTDLRTILMYEQTHPENVLFKKKMGDLIDIHLMNELTDSFKKAKAVTVHKDEQNDKFYDLIRLHRDYYKKTHPEKFEGELNEEN